MVLVNSGKDYKSLEKGNIPVYGTGGYITSVSKFLSNQDAIGLGRKGTINKPYILKAPFWTVDTLFYLTLKPENILTFIYSLIQKINWLKYDESTGLPSLSKKNIENILVYLTKLDEQQKIGKLIVKLDKFITLQQRKLEQLKQLKKAMLQQLFVDKNSKQPNLRFKNFNGDWKQRKGKSIFYSKSNKDFPELTVLSATQDKGMVPRSSTGIGIKYEKKSLRGYKKVEPGDFIVHLRSFQGGFAYSDLTGIVSPAYTVFTFKQPEMFNNYFWKEKFTSYNFIQLLKKVTYGVRDGRSISYSDFLTLNEKFPVEVEQTKIADLFKKINNLIAFQQNKLTQLTTLKKYLLQKLFI